MLGLIREWNIISLNIKIGVNYHLLRVRSEVTFREVLHTSVSSSVLMVVMNTLILEFNLQKSQLVKSSAS